MADGLLYTADGHRFFQNGKEVSGVNDLAQKESKKKTSHHKRKSSSHNHKSKKHSKSKHHQPVQSLSQEPAAKPMTGTGAEAMTPVESLREIEEHKQELAAVKKTIEDKEERKQQEEDYKKHMKADGYWHLDDGTRVDPATNQVIGGVNTHAQLNSQSELSLVQKPSNGTVEAKQANTTQAPAVSASQQNSNVTAAANSTKTASAPAAPSTPAVVKALLAINKDKDVSKPDVSKGTATTAETVEAAHAAMAKAHEAVKKSHEAVHAQAPESKVLEVKGKSNATTAAPAKAIVDTKKQNSPTKAESPSSPKEQPKE